MKFLLIVFLAASTLFYQGCASNKVEQPAIPTSEQQVLSEYKIGVGDALRIDVWKNEELSGEVAVRPDGKISVPLIGDVLAVGKPTEILAKDIATALSEYLRNPQVVVILQQAGSADYLLRVRVTGAVNTPASIPFREGMTVLDLVLAAGGLTDFASANKAKLYRRIDNEVKVYPVKLNDILNKGKLDTNYQLIPSDIVSVPTRVL